MSGSSSSSSSSNSHGSSPFHSFSTKYPKGSQKATHLAQSFHNLTKKGPRTLVATIVDTSFHVTQGYVTCTTELGIVPVYSIPYGSCVPGMRVYCRQMGGAATNRAFVFDGFAQNASRQGTTSGSFLFSSPLLTLPSTALATSQGNSISCVSGVTASTGYYWHCFFYLPELPSSTITLFQFNCGTTSSPSLSLTMLPTGVMQFSSSDGHGYQTLTPVAPHRIHWLVCQPGFAGNELLIDGFPNYSDLVGSSGDTPTFAGGINTYTVSLFGTSTGTGIPALGSWISKVGFGANGGNEFDSTIPTSDTMLVNTAGAGYYTRLLLLCEDGASSTTLLNSALGGGGSNFSILSGTTQVSPLGPY